MEDNNNLGTDNGQNNENQNKFQQQNQMNNQQPQPPENQYNNQQPQGYQYNNQQAQDNQFNQQQPQPQNFQYNQQQQNNQQQQQYQYSNQPMYQQPVNNQQPSGSNGMAIGALICGILSILVNCCSAWFISLPTAIAGIILGIMVIKNNKAGRTMAIVGLVLSSIGAFFGLIVLISCAIFARTGGMYNDIFWQIQRELENYR